MSDQLSRILYCSKNLIPGAPDQQSAVLAGILHTARTKNAALGVTGALLYNDGFFAQVLEGPKAAVESTFERIQQDERHGQVTVLECGQSPSRDFAEWSMAHVTPLTAMESAIAGDTLLRAMSSPTTNTAASHDVLELLRSLVTQDA